MFGVGTINVGVLGTGYIAAAMSETMKKISGINAYAVASRDLDRAVEFGTQHGFKRAYGSYEELLEDDRIGLVYVATPHSEHYENVKMCIEHGKAVLCEKPFALNARQAQELFVMAEEKGVFAQEAMWIRFLPFYKKIREVLSKGLIGDPVNLTASLSYNRSNVRRLIDPNLGGGALLDSGVYVLNFASMLFGDDISRIHSFCTYTDLHLDEQDSITLKYSDGRMAVLTASMISSGPRTGVVRGTKGYMIIENIHNFENLTVYDNSHKRIAFYKRPRQKTGFEYGLKACARAISNKRLECEEMPHEQTVSIMNMMDYIRKQLGVAYPAETGVPVDMPTDIPVAAAPEQEAEQARDTGAETVPDTVQELTDADVASVSDEQIAAEIGADIGNMTGGAEEAVSETDDKAFEEITQETDSAVFTAENDEPLKTSNETSESEAESRSLDDTVVIPREKDILGNVSGETASDDIGNLEQKIIENARSDAAIAASAAEIMNGDREPENK